mmetsp:Transcript_49495/g.124453  ORF Transcript_49495/g.124453 Transcript_49495/m.124453 type:complete len:224 (-) Transcript_49495:77-748(-)
MDPTDTDTFTVAGVTIPQHEISAVFRATQLSAFFGALMGGAVGARHARIQCAAKIESLAKEGLDEVTVVRTRRWIASHIVKSGAIGALGSGAKMSAFTGVFLLVDLVFGYGISSEPTLISSAVGGAFSFSLLGTNSLYSFPLLALSGACAGVLVNQLRCITNTHYPQWQAAARDDLPFQQPSAPPALPPLSTVRVREGGDKEQQQALDKFLQGREQGLTKGKM